MALCAVKKKQRAQISHPQPALSPILRLSLANVLLRAAKKKREPEWRFPHRSQNSLQVETILGRIIAPLFLKYTDIPTKCVCLKNDKKND